MPLNFAIFGFIPILTLGLSFLSLDPKSRKVADFLAIIPAVFIYLLVSQRADGIDYESYLWNYNHNNREIFDIGYSLLAGFFYDLGFEYNLYLLFTHLFGLTTILYVCRKYNASTLIVMYFFAIHVWVVKDYSQTRIGLASYVIIWAFVVDRRYLKILIGLLAVSIHLTMAIVFGYVIVSILFQGSTSRLIICGTVIVLFSLMLQKLAFLDPRVEIYLNWNSNGYGAPVQSYSILVFSFLLLLFAKLFSEGSGPIEKHFLEMIVISIVTYFAFYKYAIFANRISSTFLVLYPFVLGICFQKLVREKAPTTMLVSKFLIFFLLALAPFMRSNSSYIVERVSF